MRREFQLSEQSLYIRALKYNIYDFEAQLSSVSTDPVKSLKHLKANQLTDKDRLENARSNNYDFANDYVKRKVKLN
jgi:hypothetical protein